MTALTYKFEKATYAIEPLGGAGARMTITYTPKIFAVIKFKPDGTSEVDTSNIPPRYLTPGVIEAEQKKYAALITADRPANAFKSLQKHFADRELKKGLKT